MIPILVLAAFLVIGKADEIAKTSVKESRMSVEDINEKLDDANSEQSAHYDSSRLWNTPKDQGKDLRFTEEEKRVLRDVYSPDYYEPNIILDYRYLKSGGRGYARSDGGQILILPQRKHMPLPKNNYDTLIELLRLKHLEEMERKWGNIKKHDRQRRGPVMFEEFEDLERDDTY